MFAPPPSKPDRPSTSGPEWFTGHPLHRRASVTLDGRLLAVRPVLPLDAFAIRDLLAGLSPRTSYVRFHAPATRLTAAQLTRLLDVDHRDAETLVALDGRRVVGLAQYQRRERGGASRERASRRDDGCAGLAGPARAELALLVADAWQRHGLGGFLVNRLAEAAAEVGIAEFESHVLASNTAALALSASLGGRTERVEGATRVLVHPLAHA